MELFCVTLGRASQMAAFGIVKILSMVWKMRRKLSSACWRDVTSASSSYESMNNKRYNKCGMSLLLLLVVSATSSSAAPTQSTLLLEIVYQTSHPGIPVSETTRVYADGRCVIEGVFVEKTRSGRDRKVFVKVGKQLESDELASLISLTQQPDFLSAQREYGVTSVVDYPDWFVVTSYENDSQKSIKVINFDRGNQVQRAKVPPPVLNLLKWAKPYYFDSRN